MSAVTHSGPWTSNGKPRYIPCRCPAPTVAAATLCQSPCSPFSPKGYIARYGKKLIINNEKQTKNIMSTELGKRDKVMSVALSVPGVKVNRNEFLVAALNNLCSVEQLKQIRQFTLSGQCTCPYDSGIGLTSSKVLTAMRGCAMETVGAAQRSRA